MLLNRKKNGKAEKKEIRVNIWNIWKNLSSKVVSSYVRNYVTLKVTRKIIDLFLSEKEMKGEEKRKNYK